MNPVPKLLEAIEGGDRQAAAELLPLVYHELRQLAARRMAQEPGGHTLQPTALVHEAWIKLSGGKQDHWDGRAHFFGAAAEAMRRILVDRARRKSAIRHGGGQSRVEFDDSLAAPDDDSRLVAISESLDKFAQSHPQKAELVKLRYFVGMTIEESAESLQISITTAKRDWSFAKAWLHRELSDGGPPSGVQKAAKAP